MSHVDLIDFFPWQAIRGLASRSSSNSSSSDDSPSPDQNSTSSSSVQWMSPAAGDTFGPGELIAIKWKATDRATSPSFRVCEGDEDHCGAMVWPQIEQSGDSYATKLTAPTVVTQSAYYLQMTDDAGQVENSPLISLSPVSQGSPSSPGSSDEPGVGSSAAGNGEPQSPIAPAGSLPPSDTSNQDPMAIPSPSTTLPNSATHKPISAAEVHNRPPSLALALPLSVVGAILIAALVLAYHHRRKLASDRENEAGLLREAERTVSVQGYGGFHGQAALEELSRRSTLLGGCSDAKGGVKPIPPQLNSDVEKALIIGTLLSKLNAMPDSGTHGLIPSASSTPISPPPVMSSREPEQKPAVHQPLPAKLIPGHPICRDLPKESTAPYQSVLDKVHRHNTSSRPLWALDTIPEAASVTSDVLSLYLPSPQVGANHRMDAVDGKLSIVPGPSTILKPEEQSWFPKFSSWPALPLPSALQTRRASPENQGREIVVPSPWSDRKNEESRAERVRSWAVGTSLTRNSSSASTLVAASAVGSADRNKPLPRGPGLEGTRFGLY